VTSQLATTNKSQCSLSRFPGGLTTLHLAGDEAIKWLGMQCKR